MDRDLGFNGLDLHGLKKLSIEEVKSWLDQAETYQNLEVNPEKIKEFAGLFYPTANRIVFQFGGEYNDSGYDLSICNIQGAVYNPETKLTEYLPLFDAYNYHNSYNDTDEKGKYCPEVCAQSLKSLGYEGLSKLILEKRFNAWTNPGPDEIYSDLRYSMLKFNDREVSSEFTSGNIVFNLETGLLEGLPSVPDIYGNIKDFQ